MSLEIAQLNNAISSDLLVNFFTQQEMMVQVGDLGKDYEHCMALHRKLDDVDSDMRVDDARFTNINKLADKIIKQGCGDNKAVQQRKNDLNHK